MPSYFLNSPELTLLVYEHIDDWETKLQFALANKATFSLCIWLTSNKEFTATPSMNLRHMLNLPMTSSSIVRFRDLNHYKPIAIHSWLVRSAVKSVIIDIDHDLSINHITRICKSCSKLNVQLELRAAPQMAVFQELSQRYRKRYGVRESKLCCSDQKNRKIKRKQKRESKKKVVKKERHGKQKLKRMLKKCLELAEGLVDVPSRASTNQNKAQLPSELLKMIDNDNLKYKACNKSASKLTSHLFNSTKIANDKIDQIIRDVACQFVNCVIKFNDVYFFATSIDVFIHNNKEQDDCAYGIESFGFHDAPTATVHSKGSMGHTFYEVKIFWGYLEILVVGGYHSVGQGKFVPFLGSALKQWNYGALHDGQVLVSSPKTRAKDTIQTYRLLNQYGKRDSCRLFGLRSLKTAVSGFTPISPLNFIGHISQSFKQPNIHHFASKVLNLYASKQIVDVNVIDDLFVFFTDIKEYDLACAVSGVRPQSFDKFRQLDSKQSGYKKLLLDLACFAESSVEIRPCNLSLLLKRVDLRDRLLNVMKLGLKKAIDDQTKLIVKEEKQRAL